MNSDWLGGEVEASHVNGRLWTRLTSFFIILFQGCVIDIFFTSTYSVGQQVRSMQILCCSGCFPYCRSWRTHHQTGDRRVDPKINDQIAPNVVMGIGVRSMPSRWDQYSHKFGPGRTNCDFFFFFSILQISHPEDFFFFTSVLCFGLLSLTGQIWADV